MQASRIKEEQIMDELKEIIRTHGTYINIWIGKESTKNSLTGDKTITYSSPNRVKGILEDMSEASAVYKIPGKAVTDSKIFVCHKNYKTLFENSHKITINDDEIYYGFQNAAGNKLRIKTEGNFVRIYLIRKIF